MNINYATSHVPTAATCTACGQAFQPGDRITLNPPMHFDCDETAVLMEDLLMRDLGAITAQLDREVGT